MYHTDFLVIGGGIAGLTYALEAAKHGKVTVLFKKGLTDSSTWWAQGGIAAVQSEEDDFNLHIKDTLVAGAGLCAEKIVEVVVREGPERVEELIGRGAKFDLHSPSGGYDLHREGGHSKRRILHTADSTGKEIAATLLQAAEENENITFLPFCSAIDLITTAKLGITDASENRVLGAYVLRDGSRVESFAASRVLIATGGAGKVYRYTSNPDVATGDGIAMCYRAGLPVANMEFFQFHPTCLYHPEAKSFLITEAMRGEGAHLLGLDGKRFMDKYHSLAELAPRDIVARAIDNEMKLHGYDHVWLDITHRGEEFVREHFPTIYERCLDFGIDISKERIPVVPAAHYCCGGVVVDEMARASVAGLHVAGEAAYTGLHGANRLASNSLLEGLVFGYRAAIDAVTSQLSSVDIELPEWDDSGVVDSNEEVVIHQNWDEIRSFMWNYVGIVRSDKRLNRALRRSELIEQEIDEYYWNFKVTSDLIELRNLSLVANLTIRSAMERKESRGLHYTVNYPELGDEQCEPTVIYPSGEEPQENLLVLSEYPH